MSASDDPPKATPDETSNDEPDEVPAKEPGAGPGQLRIDRGGHGRFGHYGVGVWSISEDSGTRQVVLSVHDEKSGESKRDTYTEGDTLELGDQRIEIVKIVLDPPDKYIVVAPAKDAGAKP